MADEFAGFPLVGTEEEVETDEFADFPVVRAQASVAEAAEVAEVNRCSGRLF